MKFEISPFCLQIGVFLTLYILFVKAQVSVSGVVSCKDSCSSLLKITLSPVGSLEKDASLKQVISLSSGKFSFENVLPGKYKLEVSLLGKA
jgi:hypothetical protein